MSLLFLRAEKQRELSKRDLESRRLRKEEQSHFYRGSGGHKSSTSYIGEASSLLASLNTGSAGSVTTAATNSAGNVTGSSDTEPMSPQHLPSPVSAEAPAQTSPHHHHHRQHKKKKHRNKDQPDGETLCTSVIYALMLIVNEELYFFDYCQKIVYFLHCSHFVNLFLIYLIFCRNRDPYYQWKRRWDELQRNWTWRD